MTYFFIPMIPPTTTFQSKKIRSVNGKPVMYDSPEAKEAKAKFMAYLAQHVPEKPYTKAVNLSLYWVFPVSKNHTPCEWKISKPDLDNLNKIPMDCMTKLGYFSDDAIVAGLTALKYYSVMPGLFVKIEELDDGGLS